MKLLNDLATDYEFVDLRASPPAIQTLNRWADKAAGNKPGWQVLLNRHSRSWRELDESRRQIDDQEAACQLMQKSPLLVKRPVIEAADFFAVGFNADELENEFGKSRVPQNQ